MSTEEKIAERLAKRTDALFDLRDWARNRIEAGHADGDDRPERWIDEVTSKALGLQPLPAPPSSSPSDTGGGT